MKATIGILGAGKLGITLAQLALKAGYTVLIANSGDPKRLMLTAKILTPGAKVTPKEEVAKNADIIILALPLSKYAALPIKELSGKLVIDAMNHWEEVDGPLADLIPAHTSTSEFIQSVIPEAHIVKGLSHMGYHELHDFAAPKGSAQRKAIAFAGDTENNLSVTEFIDTIGFDPVYIGALAKGKILEPGQIGFGLSVSKEILLEKLS